MDKDFNYKVIYNLKLDGKKVGKKRVITKIIKLDEKIRYVNSMTKALPTCCIKDNDDLSWKTFNVLLEKVDLEDKIGHLYIVNIMFDAKNTFKKQLVYNEIYPPIIQK